MRLSEVKIDLYARSLGRVGYGISHLHGNEFELIDNANSRIAGRMSTYQMADAERRSTDLLSEDEDRPNEPATRDDTVRILLEEAGLALSPQVEQSQPAPTREDGLAMLRRIHELDGDKLKLNGELYQALQTIQRQDIQIADLMNQLSVANERIVKLEMADKEPSGQPLHGNKSTPVSQNLKKVSQ